MRLVRGLTNVLLAPSITVACLLLATLDAVSPSSVAVAAHRAGAFTSMTQVLPDLLADSLGGSNMKAESDRQRVVLRKILTVDFVEKQVTGTLIELDAVLRGSAAEAAWHLDVLPQRAAAAGLYLPDDRFESIDMPGVELARPKAILRLAERTVRSLLMVAIVLLLVSAGLGYAQGHQRGLGAALIGAALLSAPVVAGLFLSRWTIAEGANFAGFSLQGDAGRLIPALQLTADQLLFELRLKSALFLFATLALGLALRRWPRQGRGGALLALLLFLGAPLPVGAEEWPSWRGPRGDGISSEVLADAWPPAGPRVAWRAAVGAGYSSPVGFRDRIYLFSLVDGSSETLTAYAAGTGKILWKQSSRGGFDGGLTGSYPGTRASPLIDERTRSITTFGGSGALVRRDLENGNLIWTLDVLKATGARNLDSGTASNPVSDGKSIYVQGGDGGPIAVAVDAATGKISWKSAFRGTSGYATTVLADAGGRRLLIVVTEREIVGMDANSGATAWTQSWQNGYVMPIIQGERMFVTAARARGGTMFRFVRGGVEKLWETHDLASRFNPPVLDGAYLYGNSEGTLKCLAWADGSQAWTSKKAEYRLGFGGSMVRAGDKLVLLGDRGLLSLARATPAGVHKLGQLQLFDGEENFATPLLYRGRLYVRGMSSLVALDLPPATR